MAFILAITVFRLRDKLELQEVFSLQQLRDMSTEEMHVLLDALGMDEVIIIDLIFFKLTAFSLLSLVAGCRAYVQSSCDEKQAEESKEKAEGIEDVWCQEIELPITRSSRS